jgi:tetrahydromethanopterin S-methyltransferase subunit G
MTEEKQVIIKVYDGKIKNAYKEVQDIMEKIPYTFSKINQFLSKPFRVIDNDKMDKIKEQLNEINRKIQFHSRDTQFTRKFFTLQMLTPSANTYRVLRQILAEIENREQAIIDNYYRIQESFFEIKEIEEKLKEKNIEDLSEIEIQKYFLKLEKAVVSFANSISYFENAIKEVGYLTEVYNQIKKNKEIPDDWNEEDVEKAEYQENIRMAFRNAVRDFLVHGRIGMGTSEYMEQLGISPFEAIYDVTNYIQKANIRMNNQNPPDYDEFLNFLDEMAEKYKFNYRKVCRRLGIDENWITTEYCDKGE